MPVERIDRVSASGLTLVLDDPCMLGPSFYVEVSKVVAEFLRNDHGSLPVKLTLTGKRYRMLADGTIRPAPRKSLGDPMTWDATYLVSRDMDAELAWRLRQLELERRVNA